MLNWANADAVRQGWKISAKLYIEHEHEPWSKLAKSIEKWLTCCLPHLISRAVARVIECRLNKIVESYSTPKIFSLCIGESTASANNKAMSTAKKISAFVALFTNCLVPNHLTGEC